MKIRFLETYKVKAEGGEEYSAGHVYDLPTDSAQHFIRRGRAEPYTPAIESIAAAPQVETADVTPPEVGEAIRKTEGRELGAKGGDSVKKFKKAQSDYRKKELAE